MSRLHRLLLLREIAILRLPAPAHRFFTLIVNPSTLVFTHIFLALVTLTNSQPRISRICANFFCSIHEHSRNSRQKGLVGNHQLNRDRPARKRMWI